MQALAALPTRDDGTDFSRWRSVPVGHSYMAPTLDQTDLVAVAPADDFRGDGIYLLERFGRHIIFRASANFASGIELSHDNPTLANRHTVTRQQFRQDVRGIVVAVLKILNPLPLVERRGERVASAHPRHDATHDHGSSFHDAGKRRATGYHTPPAP